MRIAELIKPNLSRCFTGDAFHLGRILREDAATSQHLRGTGEESRVSQEQQDTLGKRLRVPDFNRDAESELEGEPPGPALCR